MSRRATGILVVIVAVVVTYIAASMALAAAAPAAPAAAPTTQTSSSATATAATAAAGSSSGQSGGPRGSRGSGGSGGPRGSGGSGASSSAQPPARVSYDQYAVIAERNIFLRERSARRTSERSTPSAAQPARPIEESFIVVGIVHEEGQYRAYVEEKALSATRRFTAGDAIARGTITRIDMDGIEYSRDGTPTWVHIGSDLTGRLSSASGGIGGIGLGGSSSAPTTGPTSLPFDPNDPNLTLEQRMRLRRLQGR